MICHSGEAPIFDSHSVKLCFQQGISGSKVFPIRLQQASPLIEKLALHEVVDPRLVDYNLTELYHMAKTAYLCVQTNPEMRPSMAEMLCLMEGENDNFQHLTEQFIPHYSR